MLKKRTRNWLSLGRQHGRVWEKPTTTGSKLQSLGRTVSLLYALEAETLQIGLGLNSNKQQRCTDTYTNNVEGKRWSAAVYQLTCSWLCLWIGSHTSSSCVQLITGCPAACRRPLTLKGTQWSLSAALQRRAGLTMYAANKLARVMYSCCTYVATLTHLAHKETYSLQ